MRYILLALLLVGCGRQPGTYYLLYHGNGIASCEKVESGFLFSTTVFKGLYAQAQEYCNNKMKEGDTK